LTLELLPHQNHVGVVVGAFFVAAAANWSVTGFVLVIYGFFRYHYARSNYVNVHLSIDKLDGTNYDTWVSDTKLWLKSQGYVDHLTHPNVAAVG